MQPLFRTVRLLLFMFIAGVIAFGDAPRPVHAQATTCNQVIDNLNRAINECSDLNFNWVCYGSVQAEAAPVKYRFNNTRDRRPFSVLEDIKTTDVNGVVLMHLLIEGEEAPLRVVLFGTVGVQTAEQAANVLTLSAGSSSYLCAATPPGMLVQTEEGTTGFVTVNGVDIELGSTAYIALQQDGLMAIANIDGEVTAIINGVRQVLAVGQQTAVTFVGGEPVFVAPQPGDSPLYASPVAQWLASNGLPRLHNSNVTELACVREVKFGETLTDQNFDAGQECLYNFCANAGDVVTVEMEALDPTLNPWVDLRGPGGWLVSFNDDTASTNLDSLICNRVMPLTSCDYTIVARSTHNATAGRFSLTLARQTACVQPALRCEVVAPTGVNLHTGPGVNYDLIQGLPQQARLQPMERIGNGWTRVQWVDTGQAGWVHETPGAIECEDDPGLMPVVRPTATPAATSSGGSSGVTRPTATPTPTPTVTPPTPIVPQKDDPFGGP